jgi:DNA-directed RNA polymerase specialized sigma24 family protein
VIERVFRDEWGRVLASLVNFLGDFDLAEEATQEAFAVAAERWPQEGCPNNPGAWLVTTARHRALDWLRRARTLTDKLRLVEANTPAHVDSLEDGVGEAPAHVPDERLELLFMSCHPSLPQDARVALTLRALGGLTTRSTLALKPRAPSSIFSSIAGYGPPSLYRSSCRWRWSSRISQRRIRHRAAELGPMACMPRNGKRGPLVHRNSQAAAASMESPTDQLMNRIFGGTISVSGNEVSELAAALLGCLRRAVTAAAGLSHPAVIRDSRRRSPTLGCGRATR